MTAKIKANIEELMNVNIYYHNTVFKTYLFFRSRMLKFLDIIISKRSLWAKFSSNKIELQTKVFEDTLLN